MRLGLVGLGRMGTGMAARLLADGHRVAGYDLSEKAVAGLVERGGAGASSLEALADALEPPRVVWVMVPHGPPTDRTIEALLPRLEAGDVLIDGGNSRYTDSVERGESCEAAGIAFLDVGVSGGVWGEEEGFNLMVGGPREAFERLEPLFRSLAPAGGYAHVGRSGAGHFVKMVHNAIEYGMLQAIGEGFHCMHRSGFELDLRQVAELWQNGSVVRSWLLELTGRAFEAEGNELDRIEGWVDDSGTGRWTVEYAVGSAIPVPVITAALYARFGSRDDEAFGARLIAALRNQFGGHAVKADT